MFPARVEANSNRCANCKFHPNITINGFGVCSNKTNLVKLDNGDERQLSTHESFSCTLHTIKVK